MARTAPIPNIPAIPGMCPGLAVLAGGAGSGGKGGKGAGSGGGGVGEGGEGGADGAAGDGRGAGNCGAGSGGSCTTCSSGMSAGDPVDATSGEVFTEEAIDLHLPGFFALQIGRRYRSARVKRNVGLGWGWTHSLAWQIREKRRHLEITDARNQLVRFPKIAVGETCVQKNWALLRFTWGYLLETGDEFWHAFVPDPEDAKLHHLGAIEDPNKNRVSLTHEDGRLIEIVDTAGRQIVVDHDPTGNITAIRVKNAATRGQWVYFARYAYDDRGNLSSVTRADGETTHFSYDNDHRMTSQTLPTGLRYTYRYDSSGRCVETWGEYSDGDRDRLALADSVPDVLADGSPAKGIYHTKLMYDDGYSEIVTSLALNRIFYGEDGKIYKGIQGAGAVTSRIYDDDGFVTSRTDAEGGVWSYSRDPRGRMLKETDPMGRILEVVRDDHGRPIQNIDAAGGVIEVARNPQGNPLTIRDQRGGIVSYTYDQRGHCLECRDARGGVTRFEGDGNGNMTKLVEPNGATWRWEYDYLGQPIKRTDPEGNETRYSYTTGMKLAGVFARNGGETRIGYDAGGRQNQRVDPLGRTTHFIWGGHNWLAERREPNGDQLRWRYNREGLLVELINEIGESYLIDLDADGRVVAETMFDGGVYKRAYDLLGREVLVTDPAGGIWEKTFNAAGDLVARLFPDGTGFDYDYDLRGDLVSVNAPNGSYRLERDPVGDIIRETQNIDGESFVVEQELNVAGDVLGVRSSLGYRARFERDNRGFRTRSLLGAQALAHQRNLIGHEVRRQLPDGAFIDDEVDPMALLKRRSLVRPGSNIRTDGNEPDWIGPARSDAVIDKAYSYTANVELAQVWDDRRGPRSYEYDSRGRLTALRRDDGPDELYRYDPANNPHDVGEEAQPRRYGRGNLLEERGNTKYLWDELGHVVEKRTNTSDGEKVWRFGWTGNGMLASIERPDRLLVENQFDPWGRRMTKRVKRRDDFGVDRLVEMTRFVWNEEQLIHEICQKLDDAGDPIVEERTYGYDDAALVPMAQRTRAYAKESRPADDGEWLFYVSDVLGTPEELVTGSGRVKGTLERSAFGKTRCDGATTPWRFEGQYEDVETGLAYNRYRFYDPELGRYISQDPLGILEGENFYLYCKNPINFVDPLGLYWPHTCTASLETPAGSGNTTSPPDPVYRNLGDCNGQNSSGSGFYSGYSNNGERVTMHDKWPGRETAPQGTGWNAQSASHTERKAMEWARGTGQNLNGGRLTLGGTRPPCRRCNAAMRQFSAPPPDGEGCEVVYNWGNQTRTYTGGQVH